MNKVKETIRVTRSKLPFARQQQILSVTLRNKLKVDELVESGVLFIHIPKCAGTSITKSLEGRMDLPAGHYSASTYQKVLENGIYTKLHKFTVVRNPWDRLVSAYFYVQDERHTMGPNAFYQKKINKIASSFPEFVKKCIGEGMFLHFNHFVPQCEFVADRAGLVLVDDIIQLESLPMGLGDLGKRIDFNFPDIKMNTSKRTSDYREYYDSDMKAIVSEVYKDDIEMFGYGF